MSSKDYSHEKEGHERSFFVLMEASEHEEEPTQFIIVQRGDQVNVHEGDPRGWHVFPFDTLCKLGSMGTG